MIDNTVMSPVADTGAEYAMLSLRALRSAHAVLFAERSEYKNSSGVSCDCLFTLFENIKHSTLSMPPSQANFGFSTGYSPCYYHRPVWEAVDEVLKNQVESAKFPTPQARAEWFQGILRLCVKYNSVQALMKTLMERARDLNLKVDQGDFSCPISVTLNPEETGANARALARELVPKMLQAVEDLIGFH